MLNRFLISLVPGLAITIGVAVACSIWAPWPDELSTHRENLRWASAVPDDWPQQPTRIHNVKSTGLTAVTAIASSPEQMRVIPGFPGRKYVTKQKWRQWELRAGLPMRCIYLTRQGKETIASKVRPSLRPLGKVPPQNWREGVSVPKGTPFYDERGMRFVPMQPLLFGLLVNSIFWAAPVWCLWMLLRLLRAKARLRRRRCPRCAYPYFTSTPNCPECGQQIKPETLKHWMDAIRWGN